MNITWQKAFSNCKDVAAKDPFTLTAPLHLSGLSQLKLFLDCVQIKHCLLRSFFETSRYPVCESRELLPSFEADAFEYKHLPGFSMVAFARPINYFQEIFQFDILHNILDEADATMGMACPLEQTVIEQNLHSIQNRLPKALQEEFHAKFTNKDVSDLEHYPQILPYLLQLDRAHVLAHDSYGHFYLSGIFGSFPSDLDTEIKRFGLRIKKFTIGDNVVYERNRLFVYQFLMELYGFPIVSERRTSSALFARRLHKLGENFMIRVLGQSDRAITTLWTPPNGPRAYPTLEKVCLVRVEKEQKEVIRKLKDGGFFLDPRRRVVILRVLYKQHRFNPFNVRQDRALSVEGQEVIHPITGETRSDLNIIKDASNMVLRLNDIVRGEYTGRIVYKRHELVENTDTEEKRLKFLYAWLSKHQRRIIGYSDDFFANVVRVLDMYLLSPNNYETFNSMSDLYREVWTKYSYIQQARKVRMLEDLCDRHFKGKNISYLEMYQYANELLNELKYEIINYFDELVSNIVGCAEFMLNDGYVRKKYIEPREDSLSDYGRDVRKVYRRLVSLLDEFKSIRKNKTKNPPPSARLKQ